MVKLSRLEKSMFWIVDALTHDKDYYHAWRANIAMAMYDTMKSYEGDNPIDMCNLAAEKFLNILMEGKK